MAAAKVKTKRKNRFDLSKISKSISEKLGIELPEENGDKFFSPNEIGEAMGVTGEAVKQWIYHQRLPAVKLANGYWQVKKTDLEVFLKRKHESAKRRVMLASKDAAIAEQIRACGHDVIIGSSKADLILKASVCIPALFIIDSTDKAFDAWNLVKKIRATKGLNKCPVILIGAPLSDAQLDEGMRLKIGSVIEDYKSDQFAAELKQHLG